MLVKNCSSNVRASPAHDVPSKITANIAAIDVRNDMRFFFPQYKRYNIIHAMPVPELKGILLKGTIYNFSILPRLPSRNSSDLHAVYLLH